MSLIADPASAADFQHALIVIADDLGTDKVGAYAVDVDNPTETRPSTPNMDALAAAGVRFSDAWASPFCSPTRAMLYTGEYPSRNGIGHLIQEGTETSIPLSPDSLQQLAQDAGLQTALFGKAHIGEVSQTPDAPTTSALDLADFPILSGFDSFQGNTDGEINTYRRWLYMQSTPSSSMTSGYSTRAAFTTTSPTNQTTSDALTWLNARSAEGARRLAVVSYHLPHATGNPPYETWDSAVVSCGGVASSDRTTNQETTVTCLDTELAELFAGVPDLEDTLVVFLGDNGTPKAVAEGKFDDDRGKSTIYENGIRVPFMIVDGAALRESINNGGVLPSGGSYRIEPELVSSDPASMVDVFATVADLLDLSTPSCVPGETCGRDSLSLRSVLEGGAPERTWVWTELNEEPTETGAATGDGALRIGDMKLVVHVAGATAPCRTYDLFDLANDRWELHDVFDDPAYATEQAELIAQLDVLAADFSDEAVDWLNHVTCTTCEETETWYDGVDQTCDPGSDFDQDGDGHDWPDDCVDTDPTVFPGAADTWYDGVDGDCSGGSDFDQDADGADLADDCDDTDPTRSPAATEIWYDGVDQNCDGAGDFDQDGDTWDLADDCDDIRADVWPGAVETAYDGVDADCLQDSDFDLDGDGFDSADWGGTDCDDFDAAVWPGAPEASGDGVDADCDGTVEPFDADSDGWETGLDCDDTDPAVFPGAIEIPYDGVDEDCGGDDDYDLDLDGVRALIGGGTDCDDTSAVVLPGAIEIWYDGVDQNCDGADDYDQDADGYPSSSYGGTDCNDTSTRIRPGTREVWYDGVDQNCDGRSDYDKDGDGVDASTYGGTDCDDTKVAVKPGATEIWYDGVDQNCDGRNDYDRDGDGWPRDTDCNDGAARIYPGAPGWNLDCTRR